MSDLNQSKRMNVSEFADAQRSHHTVYPSLPQSNKNDKHIPFVKLLSGKESEVNVEKRWELYHQLHSHFHDQVDHIIDNIEADLKAEISDLLYSETTQKRRCFNTIFLLGSDSTTKIELKDESSRYNVLIELTPKESPNVRMMLRRSMYKLYSAADAEEHPTIKYEDINDEDGDFTEQNNDVSYDLSLVENFKRLFGKDLAMVFNFKDVDSINFNTLDNFIILLKSAFKYVHVKISLIFNINTNLSNIEKNLRQSTIRLLKRNYHKLDVSSNKGFKYGNQIFQSFLDTVDGKLNLSDRFVEFILSKMANNTNHNLQLLTKMLDYSLMSYFFQNAFSVFIDPVNVDFLNDDYLKILSRCPTFMFFVEGLIKQHAPADEILSLLTNKNRGLEEFFVEFLVRENPINGHAKFVARFLEEELNITNFNLIELYHNLLIGKLDSYLDRWSACKEYKDRLHFEPIDTIFQELFTLDNRSGLLTQSIFPSYKSNIEDNLLSWEQVLPSLDKENYDTLSGDLDRIMAPVLGQLFKLYREANMTINIYDFYIAFRETLPKEEILNFIRKDPSNTKLLELAETPDAFDKVALILFMQAIFAFENMGLIKFQSTKSYDLVEKCVWRGI
ncbi:BBM_1a_G0034730.mRNA.1.CDS.1 [Saccharomyces cerevisiae]|nr:Orc3p [Saccharomyces cerevisiae YJM1399]CAI4606081.1 CPI_1c_G0034560.mRNA.1.CDS.1 [Saccharomyces cerevisiae]CAI4616424.1 BBM_1a_G0034730.mRNA.1.CDS.1 [Saccharomyces cerevisiae]CAI4624939.1 ADE_G0034590.mRNA.1.CDS.1 [Saccharomyces cerevisiae]CAI6786446.1 ADE_G0034590.mRNA.1.CDS.1 [Saccharomyces cerevisiae]